MKPLLQFFIFTFVLSWAAFITANAVSQSTHTAGSGFTTEGYAIYLIGVFAPALVSIFISWHQKKRAGVINLLGGILRTPRNWYWYVFAIAYFLVIKLLAALVYRILQGHWPMFGGESFFIIFAAIVVSTPFQAGEEIGWRGFALPRLTDRFGLAIASIILGIVWALWHLPFFFLSVADKYGQSFPMYSLSVVALSVAMAWLYWRTSGSLLLTMLMHSAINNTTGVAPSTVAGANDPFSMHASSVAWITTVLLWAPAVYFLARMRGKKEIMGGRVLLTDYTQVIKMKEH